MNLDNKRKPVTRANRTKGAFPYYGANGIQDFVDEFLLDGTFLLLGEDGSVVTQDGSPVVNWASGKIWVNNHAHVLAEKSDELSLRFLYHYLQTISIRSFVSSETRPKLTQARMNEIPIPIPDREEQDRVVKLLDRFDELVNDLNSGLPGELNTRRQQYEYYRDKLLTFEEATA